MKFTIVVVMLALALGAQSSILPWHGLIAGHGISHAEHVSGAGIWDGHLGLGHGAVIAAGHAGPLLAQGPALGHAAIVAHAPAVVAAHAPAVVAAHAPAVVAHAPAAVAVAHGHVAIAPIAHEGHYVAKTRGAVHTAPLAGHINSAASVNLAPAPGTI